MNMHVLIQFIMLVLMYIFKYLLLQIVLHKLNTDSEKKKLFLSLAIFKVSVNFNALIIISYYYYLIRQVPVTV